MFNKKIIHTIWGIGVVTNFDGESITISFDDIGEKKLSYPMAFEKGFIKMAAESEQTAIMKVIADEAQAATDRKLQAKATQEVAAKAILNSQKSKTKKASTETHTSSVEAISDLKVGFVYTNDDLRKVFKVSPQGGMRKSNTTNSLVLISKHSDDPEKNPYEDKWDEEGLFHYTGMGLVGDQDLNYKQNKTLNESNRNGVNVYLFESNVSNEYTYQGEVILAKPAYVINEQDANDKIRKVYKFPLKLVD